MKIGPALDLDRVKMEHAYYTFSYWLNLNLT